MLGRRLAVHRRHDDGGTDAAFRTHGAEEIIPKPAERDSWGIPKPVGV
jgi:hypothetical protein